MHTKIDDLYAQHDRLKRERPSRRIGALEGRKRTKLVGLLKWHDHNAKDNPPFLDALAKARDIAVREGWCYFHAGQ